VKSLKLSYIKVELVRVVITFSALTCVTDDASGDWSRPLAGGWIRVGVYPSMLSASEYADDDQLSSVPHLHTFSLSMEDLVQGTFEVPRECLAALELDLAMTAQRSADPVLVLANVGYNSRQEPVGKEPITPPSSEVGKSEKTSATTKVVFKKHDYPLVHAFATITVKTTGQGVGAVMPDAV